MAEEGLTFVQVGARHARDVRDVALRDESGQQIRKEPSREVDKSSPFGTRASAAAQAEMIPFAVAFCAPGVDVPSVTVPFQLGRFAVKASHSGSR